MSRQILNYTIKIKVERSADHLDYGTGVYEITLPADFEGAAEEIRNRCHAAIKRIEKAGGSPLMKNCSPLMKN